MPATNPRLIDIHELSDMLRVAEATIKNNRHTHPLYKKAIKLGAANSPLKWRITDVDAYLAELAGEAASA
ncbi:hypothetical protein CH267_02010 [Rhodococcus sp. 06-621-2]|nr:hypothetical protein [Rhodococcus sp. 06-621-2]OZC62333.1 hypothetical protein CH267_02010 [Rhodococcus sp. 06-621-2]